MDQPRKNLLISDLLTTGEENAKTGRVLCEILNLKARELTEAIERERRQGHPICASCGKTPGYFLAATREEMAAYCNRLKHRAGEIFKTRQACLKTLDNLPPQEGAA